MWSKKRFDDVTRSLTVIDDDVGIRYVNISVGGRGDVPGERADEEGVVWTRGGRPPTRLHLCPIYEYIYIFFFIYIFARSEFARRLKITRAPDVYYDYGLAHRPVITLYYRRRSRIDWHV